MTLFVDSELEVPLQVEAAIKEQSPSSSGASKANGVSPHTLRQQQGQPGSGSNEADLQATEGAESALLYVRFRAAAESELRGAFHLASQYRPARLSILLTPVVDQNYT